MRAVGDSLAFLEHYVYLIALLGLAIFYGLERAAKLSRQWQRALGDGDATRTGVFWIHIASFAVYNALISYLLLHREEPGFKSLAFFVIAMALPFVVNDQGLREHHKIAYTRVRRWMFAGAVFLGWGLDVRPKYWDAAIAVLLAFLAGGVILNVLKKQLPEERESRFWAFALGAGVFALLLLGL